MAPFLLSNYFLTLEHLFRKSPGILSFSILLYEKIDNKFSSTILALFLVIISFFITRNSKSRVKLYSDLLGQSVKTAQEIEKKIIKEANEQLTNRLQSEVKHAGMKGEKLYLNSVNAFFIIEIIILVYFLIRTGLYLWLFFSKGDLSIK
jgi:hypothetical protein